MFMQKKNCLEAGVGIQYIVPAMLCYFGRKKVVSVLGSEAIKLNPHRSLFGHRAWVYVVSIWALLCVLLVTFNYIYDSVHSSGSSNAPPSNGTLDTVLVF